MHTDHKTTHYKAPGMATRWVMNPVVAGLAKIGLGLAGARELTVLGRSSGVPRSVPVNPVEVAGVSYLVAPRGHTDWVKNLRSAGRATLRLGRRVDHVVAAEVLDEAEYVVVVREYLRRWAWEVGAFFDGVDAGSTDEQLAAIASHHPMFRLAVDAALTGP